MKDKNKKIKNRNRLESVTWIFQYLMGYARYAVAVPVPVPIKVKEAGK